MADLTGQSLKGRYRLESSIGHGGMAEVYKAWDNKRNYYVAIKVLREELAEDQEFDRRFMREAEALAQLTHNHIIRFYSFERTGTLAFIVMDYVEGITLRRRIYEAGGPLPLGEVLKLVQQIASALHYAHTQGILHRDVKPGNIMLRPDGTALLADFGIARVMDIGTMTAATPGTPAYMSPEQCRSEALDKRADVYSLGVVVYEMLAGRRPFVGEQTPETVTGGTGERIRWEQVYATPPPVRQYNPGIMPEVEAVVLRALAKKPETRWPTALAFSQALVATVGDAETFFPRSHPILQPPLPLERPSLSRSNPWGRIITVGSVGIIMVLVLFWAAMGKVRVPSLADNPSSASPLTTTFAPSPSPQLTHLPQIIPALETSQVLISPTPQVTELTTTPEMSEASNLYVEYIVDASNGMMTAWDGQSTKLRAVQEALTRHWQQLGTAPHIGLRVYGHRRHATDADSCQDVELLAPIAANHFEKLFAALQSLQARGMDCRGEALRQALTDFEYRSGRVNALVLIAEGADTCGDDPVQVVSAQHEVGVDLPVYVINLTNSQYELGNIAYSSGGQYFEALDIVTLDRVLAVIAQNLEVVATSCMNRACYITHIVQPGDTMFGIAIHYGASLDDLRRVNKSVLNDELYIGQEILIPLDLGSD